MIVADIDVIPTYGCAKYSSYKSLSFITELEYLRI